MKRAMFLGVSMAAIGLLCSASAVAGLTTFDDVSTDTIDWGIANGYGGLDWNGYWGVLKGTAYDPLLNGYKPAVVSQEYVAFNSDGHTVDISAADPFNLVSAYFGAAWRRDLLIEVEGFRDGASLYSTSFTVNPWGSEQVVFDWEGVDMVTFASSGGTPNWLQTGTQFAMDNLVTEPVPEPPTPPTPPVVPAPGAVLLSGLGAGLVGWLRRRKSL